eukprot:scaffold41262_cov31-Tisochrysis_lutea.AAC.2
MQDDSGPCARLRPVSGAQEQFVPHLDVSVQDTVVVAIGETLEELPHVALDLSRREAMPHV